MPPRRVPLSSPRVWGTRFDSLQSSSPPQSPALSALPRPPPSTSATPAHNRDASAQPTHSSSNNDASIFVGSLPPHVDHAELSRRLVDHLRAYLDVKQLKVIRDSRGGVCAFVRCKDPAAASQFIQDVRARSIEPFMGRALRFEHARSSRTLLFSYKTPTRALDAPGAIETLEPATAMRLSRAHGSRFVTVLYNAEAVQHRPAVSGADSGTSLEGDGLFFSPLRYDEQNLSKIVSAFGPIEHFCVYAPSTGEHGDEYMPSPHDQPRLPDMDGRCWEVKWEHRDDCMDALMSLRTVPHLTVSWAHLAPPRPLPPPSHPEHESALLSDVEPDTAAATYGSGLTSRTDVGTEELASEPPTEPDSSEEPKPAADEPATAELLASGSPQPYQQTTRTSQQATSLQFQSPQQQVKSTPVSSLRTPAAAGRSPVTPRSTVSALPNGSPVRVTVPTRDEREDESRQPLSIVTQPAQHVENAGYVSHTEAPAPHAHHIPYPNSAYMQQASPYTHQPPPYAHQPTTYGHQAGPYVPYAHQPLAAYSYPQTYGHPPSSLPLTLSMTRGETLEDPALLTPDTNGELITPVSPYTHADGGGASAGMLRRGGPRYMRGGPSVGVHRQQSAVVHREPSIGVYHESTGDMHRDASINPYRDAGASEGVESEKYVSNVELGRRAPRAGTDSGHPERAPSGKLLDYSTIFVGGMEMYGPNAWDEARVRAVFARFGAIEGVKFIRPVHKKSAFAFVRFRDIESSAKAVTAEHNKIYAGRQLRVQIRESDPQRPFFLFPHGVGGRGPRAAGAFEVGGMQRRAAAANANGAGRRTGDSSERASEYGTGRRAVERGAEAGATIYGNGRGTPRHGGEQGTPRYGGGAAPFNVGASDHGASHGGTTDPSSESILSSASPASFASTYPATTAAATPDPTPAHLTYSAHPPPPPPPPAHAYFMPQPWMMHPYGYPVPFAPYPGYVLPSPQREGNAPPVYTHGSQPPALYPYPYPMVAPTLPIDQHHPVYSHPHHHQPHMHVPPPPPPPHQQPPETPTRSAPPLMPTSFVQGEHGLMPVYAPDALDQYLARTNSERRATSRANANADRAVVPPGGPPQWTGYAYTGISPASATALSSPMAARLPNASKPGVSTWHLQSAPTSTAPPPPPLSQSVKRASSLRDHYTDVTIPVIGAGPAAAVLGPRHGKGSASMEDLAGAGSGGGAERAMAQSRSSPRIARA